MYILCLIFGITQVIMGRIIGLISIFTNSEMCYLVLPSKKCFYFANIIDEYYEGAGAWDSTQ